MGIGPGQQCITISEQSGSGRETRGQYAGRVQGEEVEVISDTCGATTVCHTVRRLTGQLNALAQQLTVPLNTTAVALPAPGLLNKQPH